MRTYFQSLTLRANDKLLTVSYSDSECKGQRNKGEAVYINESRDRFPDWNDKTRSIKCFMEY